MGNWIPNDPTLVAQILKISSSYSPPPPEGFISPMTWGIESSVIERFAAAGVPEESVTFLRDTFTFRFPGSPVSRMSPPFTDAWIFQTWFRCIESIEKCPWSRSVMASAYRCAGQTGLAMSIMVCPRGFRPAMAAESILRFLGEFVLRSESISPSKSRRKWA